MTRVEIRIMATLFIAILGGGVWFLAAKHRLEGEIAAARTAPSSGMGFTDVAESSGAPTSASDASRSSANARPFAVAPPVTTISPRVREMGSLIASGMMGRMTWKRPPDNNLFATFETVAQVLDLSPAEADVLLDQVESSNQAVVQGILSATTVTRPSPEKVVMVVRDSSEAQIAAIQMQDSVREILGEERYRIYEDLGIKAVVDETFGKMGLGATTLTFSKGQDEHSAQRAPYSYSSQKPGNTGGFSACCGDRDWYEANLWPLSELLPDDF